MMQNGSAKVEKVDDGKEPKLMQDGRAKIEKVDNGEEVEEKDEDGGDS